MNACAQVRVCTHPNNPQEIAPVQLPEPAGWIDDGGMVFWNDGRKPNDGEIIYTEQQVRELLAAHGIPHEVHVGTTY